MRLYVTLIELRLLLLLLLFIITLQFSIFETRDLHITRWLIAEIWICDKKTWLSDH